MIVVDLIGLIFKWPQIARIFTLGQDASGSLTNGFLDPWCKQTVHAPIFLNFIRRKINREPQFMIKIRKRYRIFKDHVDSPSYVPIVPPPQPLPDNVVTLKDYRKRVSKRL